MDSAARGKTSSACILKSANQNRNFLQVNPKCTAQDLLAILQDYYEQFNLVEEPPLGTKNPIFPTSPGYLLRRKKKKLIGGSPPRHSPDRVPPLNKHFAFFAGGFQNMEDLLRQLEALNKNCEKEINKNLKEVFLLV